MSQSNNKPVALVLGAAVATGTLVAGSLFSMQAMANGYMQDAPKAEAKATEGKCGEGKCGEGKCGGSKPADAKHAHEGGCGMAKMDTDKDGRLSRAEFDAAHKGKEEKFASHDLDGDGFISQAEMDAHHLRHRHDGRGGVIGQLLEEELVHRHGRRIEESHRVAVRRRLDQRLGRDHGCATGLVVDDEGLAGLLGQHRRDLASQVVGGASCRIGNDDPHRLGGEAVRHSGQSDQSGGRDSGPPANPCISHDVSPAKVVNPLNHDHHRASRLRR